MVCLRELSALRASGVALKSTLDLGQGGRLNCHSKCKNGTLIREIGCENEMNLIAEWVTQLSINSIQSHPISLKTGSGEIGCENVLNLMADWVTQLPINFIQKHPICLKTGSGT